LDQDNAAAGVRAAEIYGGARGSDDGSVESHFGGPGFTVERHYLQTLEDLDGKTHVVGEALRINGYEIPFSPHWTSAIVVPALRSSHGMALPLCTRPRSLADEEHTEWLRKVREFPSGALDPCQSGASRAYMAEHVYNDFEIMMAAVQQDGETVLYASADLKNDPGIAMAAVQQNGHALRDVSAAMQNVRDIVNAALKSAAVNCHQGVLQYASADLRNDFAIVKRAVTLWGNQLQYASDALKNNSEIVTAALENDVNAIGYIGEKLQKDPKFKNRWLDHINESQAWQDDYDYYPDDFC